MIRLVITASNLFFLVDDYEKQVMWLSGISLMGNHNYSKVISYSKIKEIGRDLFIYEP